MSCQFDLRVKLKTVYRQFSDPFIKNGFQRSPNIRDMNLCFCFSLSFFWLYFQLFNLGLNVPDQNTECTFSTNPRQKSLYFRKRDENNSHFTANRDNRLQLSTQLGTNHLYNDSERQSPALVIRVSMSYKN